MKKILILLLIFILGIFNVIYAENKGFQNLLKDKEIPEGYELNNIVKEVMDEYDRIGYYCQTSWETIKLGDKEMLTRMDCSGLMSAYITNYGIKILNKDVHTGLDNKDENNISLSSIHFENDWDKNHTKYVDNVDFIDMNSLNIGDILWNGGHFILFGGESGNKEYPYVFYQWTGDKKEEDSNYRDYNAPKYSVFFAKTEIIDKELKIIPLDINNSYLLRVRNYNKFYRLKNW